jgi:guanylate kinase
MAPRRLLLIGPSACGKSTLVRALVAAGIVRLHPTWTTRPPRPGEVEGRCEHRFVDEAAFERLDADGFFLDSVRLFGLPHRYGLPPLPPVGADGIVDTVMLRAPLVERFRQVVGDAVVYQVDAPGDAVRARLAARGASECELTARLADNEREAVLGRRLADRTFRNDGSLETLVAGVAHALVVDGLTARTAA